MRPWEADDEGSQPMWMSQERKVWRTWSNVHYCQLHWCTYKHTHTHMPLFATPTLSRSVVSDSPPAVREMPVSPAAPQRGDGGGGGGRNQRKGRVKKDGVMKMKWDKKNKRKNLKTMLWWWNEVERKKRRSGELFCVCLMKRRKVGHLGKTDSSKWVSELEREIDRKTLIRQCCLLLWLIALPGLLSLEGVWKLYGYAYFWERISIYINYT